MFEACAVDDLRSGQCDAQTTTFALPTAINRFEALRNLVHFGERKLGDTAQDCALLLSTHVEVERDKDLAIARLTLESLPGTYDGQG